VHDLRAVGGHFWDRRGLFSGQQLETFVDELLCKSPRLRHLECPEGELTFGVVRRELLRKDSAFFVPPLVLTATNLTKRKLELLSPLDEKYSNVKIARAVRASAGFPAVLQPVDMPVSNDRCWFADGGMISNFPAWVFTQSLRRQMEAIDRYRGLAATPWMHIGLRVVDDVPARAPDLGEPEHWMKSLFGLIRGSSRDQLEEVLASFLPRSWLINQTVAESQGPDDLFDLKNTTGNRVEAMYNAGFRASTTTFRSPNGPGVRLPSDDRVNPILCDVIRRCLRVFGKESNQELDFRCNVFLRFGDRLVMVYAENMDDSSHDGALDRDGDDPDLFIDFLGFGGNVGMVYQHRQPHFTNLEKVAEMNPNDRETVFGMGRSAQERIKPGRSMLLTVPIFDAKECRTVAREPRIATKVYRMESCFDGPVFGTLSIDSKRLPTFGRGGPDPERHSTDPRVLAILNIVTDASFRLGAMFSDAFGERQNAN
jgi:hypothetical protein